MANIKISDLTAAAAATGTQEFEVNDSLTSKKVTGAQILAYVEGEVSSSPSFTGQVSIDDGSASAPSLTNTGDSNTGLYFPAADTVAISTGGTKRFEVNSSGTVTLSNNQVIEVTDNSNAALRVTQLGTGAAIRVEDETNPDSTPFVVDANGKVGIGTASPSYNLTSVYAGNNTIITDYAFVGGSDTYQMIGLSENTAANEFAITNKYSSGGIITLRTGSGGTISERMRIDSSGNVGIGTGSPSYKLDVSATGTSIGARIQTNQQDATLSFLGSGGVNGYVRVGASDNNLFFMAGNAERMRIDASGNVLLNTTDTTLYNNTSGTGACYRVGASFDILSASDNALILNRCGTDGGIAEFRKGGTVVGSITVNGTSTGYNTSSDYRLKEDIRPIASAVDRVNALKPVNFAWKVNGSRVDGFIAHEAQEVVPESVTGAKDAVDVDGNPVYQGIDQSKLVPLLTAALQEALTEISSLKARVAALEAA